MAPPRSVSGLSLTTSVKPCKANSGFVAVFGFLWRFSAAGHQGHQPPDVGRRQLVRPQADDPPPRQSRLQVFFQVGGESRPAVVAAVYVEAAVDLDPGPARQVGEVGPPLANRVEPT